MARPKRGSLALRPGGYAARLTTAQGRQWVPLGTHNEDEAQGKLSQLVAQRNQREELLETYADLWLRQRQASGIVMAKEERTYWLLHCRTILGPLRLSEARPMHIRQVLDQLVQKGKSKQTVRHVKGFLHRLFASAWRDDAISENPVDKVMLPKIRSIKKERVILTDEEFTIFIACDQVDEELRMVSLLSRILGGMRAGDLHQLDWAMLGPPSFEEAHIPRSKTSSPQTLMIPEALRSHLAAWWAGQGEPEKGPVFPARRGERKGLQKLPESSYAKRLRKALRMAGLTRRELFEETPTSKPVDFHSFRRAFVSALSGANVPLQRAMKLSGHTSARTHSSYIVGAQEIPWAVIPDLGAKTSGGSARPKGLEPLTNGLEGRLPSMISLASMMLAALEAGTLDIARVALEALGKLLG